MFPTRLITVLKRLSVPAGLLSDMRAYHIFSWENTAGAPLYKQVATSER